MKTRGWLARRHSVPYRWHFRGGGCTALGVDQVSAVPSDQ